MDLPDLDFSELFRWFAEWIDPATEPKEPSNDPKRDQEFEKQVEQNPRLSDPVYRANLRRLIERNSRFEDTKE